MNNVFVLLLTVFLFQSCKSNYSNEIDNNFLKFKEQISKSTFEKYVKKMPLINSAKNLRDLKYYDYYKIFGNAGVSTLVLINDESKETALSKIKSFKLLNKDFIFQDSKYVFNYIDNKTNLNIKIPKIPEFEDSKFKVNSIKTFKDSGIKTFLIENGQLENIYIKELNPSKEIYNYTLGIYLSDDETEIIYWYLFY